MSLRVVWTVLGGVPGTYRAAREVAGRRVAVGVLAASGWSLLVALVNTGARPRLRNAVRHFTWSAWLAARYGEAVARAVTEEHELHSLDLRDSEADDRNNRAGRRYGTVHRDEILQRRAPSAIWRLAGVGRRRWYSGRLWSVRDGAVVAGSRGTGRRTR
ncbi:hypothetical protein SAMN04487968_10979 [Nocardioides terrae]|uniref:Uncharacterized protein n=1 Tax=Nocardioides terrae TaxID=574651 RepID=A0A1I1KZX2_9ACTN|nr:hypothetical protein [Nocardioides terrae]SFC66215.1 hypothetical protein SAMN04487968_10979 [Nocardioides terrae]